MRGAWPIRPDERPAGERRTGAEPGIKFCHPDGTVFWFPGATAGAALVLVRASVPEEFLSHPNTRIVFGTRDGRRFVEVEVLKEFEKTEATRGADPIQL